MLRGGAGVTFFTFAAPPVSHFCARRGFARRTAKGFIARQYDAGLLLVKAFGFGEALDYGEVFERSCVAGDAALCSNFPEEAAHDLAAAGFREHVTKADFGGARDGADGRGD